MYQRNNKWKRIIAAVIVVLVIVAMLGTSLVAMFAYQAKAQTNDNYIYQGVSIDGTDLGGKGVEQARRMVDEYMESLKDYQVTLSSSKKEHTISLRELGLSYSNQNVVDTAFQLGKGGNVIRRYKDKKDLEQEGIDLRLELTVDKNQVQSILQEKDEDFVTHAKDASIIRRDGKLSVKKEQVGQRLNVSKTIEQLEVYLNEEWSRDDDCMVAVVTDQETPKHTAEELGTIKDKLGTYYTDYSGSSANRKINVGRAAELLDGIILYPGETLSVQDIIGPIDDTNGYALAGSYLNGKVVDSFGGGVCQVSTTLYNAVIRAELEVVERHNHTMTVHYVPLSSDAAIATGAMDFIFKNNQETPVYIATDADGINLYISIYGKETRSAKRTIKFRSETLETYAPAEEAIVTEDDTLPKGERIVTQQAVTGYKAQLYKDIYKNGKKIKSVLVNTSVYTAEPEHVTIGTKKVKKAEKSEATEETQEYEKDVEE
jgi:vancomycin resistance protein YoaR